MANSRMVVAGVGLIFVVVGTALMWHVYGDNNDGTSEAVNNYSIFLPWWVAVFMIAAVHFSENEGGYSAVCRMVAWGTFFFLWTYPNPLSNYNITSYSYLTTLRKLIQSDITDTSDNKKLYAGGVIAVIGMCFSVFSMFEKKEGDDNGKMRMMTTALTVVAGLVSSIMWWAGADTEYDGNGAANICAATTIFLVMAAVYLHFSSDYAVAAAVATIAGAGGAFTVLSYGLNAAYTLASSGESDRAIGRAAAAVSFVTVIASVGMAASVLKAAPGFSK